MSLVREHRRAYGADGTFRAAGLVGLVFSSFEVCPCHPLYPRP